jgi:integrase
MTIHTTGRLKDKAIKATTEPGRYNDGGGLYFIVTERGGRSWEYRFDLNGKRRYMGLGGYPDVTLGKARELHQVATAMVRAGTDPINARKADKQIAASSLSVMEAAERYLAVKEVDWETERYPEQIRERLDTYVRPTIGDLPISDIGLAEAKRVLEPIWNTIRPTAKRIRQHLEGAVNWAIAEGVRKAEFNPFEVKRLEFSLSFADQKVTHRASLAHEQAPEFIALLRAEQESVKTLALEFVVLNAVRVADVVGGGKQHSEPMRWSHVNLVEKTWRIPDTKMGRPHVVPLSDAALRVLARVKRFRDPKTNYVFPGAVKGTVISDATLRYLIADLGYKGLATTHGFRATFRTWASDTTTYEKGVIEAALAHAQGELDSAYHRGSYLSKRKKLMAAWAGYLAGEAVRSEGSVVAITRQHAHA